MRRKNHFNKLLLSSRVKLYSPVIRATDSKNPASKGISPEKVRSSANRVKVYPCLMVYELLFFYMGNSVGNANNLLFLL